MLNLFYKIRWFFTKSTPKKSEGDFIIDMDFRTIDWSIWNKYYATRNEYGSGVLPMLSCIKNRSLISTTNDSEQYPFKTGYLCTKGNYAQTFGSFELTCKVPKDGKKYWSAFWMFSKDWLPEVDIFEFMGKDSKVFSTTLHYGDVEHHKQKGRSLRGQDLSKGFHKYKLEWTPKALKWYIDDIAIYRLTKHIPQEPMWVLINGMGDIRGGFIKEGEVGVFELQRLLIRE